MRMKDLTALELSGLDGAPEFQPDWREPDKDAAIAQMIEFLRTHEKALRAFPTGLRDAACPAEYVYLGK